MNDSSVLALSFFDQIVGPRVFYSTDVSIEDDSRDFPDLGRILEFNDEEGTFIFAFRKYQTINKIFMIDSEIARGGKEMLMISYMIKSAFFKNEIVDVFKYLESKRPDLDKLADELSNISELATILHSHHKPSEISKLIEIGSEEFQIKFKELFDRYQKILSPRSMLEIPVKATTTRKKIFIYGSKAVGKTTFLKSIESIQFHNQTNNDLPTRIYELVIDNIEIMTFDCIDKGITCEKCKNLHNCINKTQGFIFVLNVSDGSSLEEAKEKYAHVINACSGLDNERTPILIIGNKFEGVEEITPEMVEEAFDFKDAEECGMKVKYFPMNIIQEEDQVMRGLRWLIHHII